MWIYGCLSEDTEILTNNGFKNFHEITKDDVIKVYDIENGIYKWEKPERWNVYSVNKDTCYRIKSDSTDQLVSRNHRCLIEREGKLVFEFAENLNGMERVPVLSYDIPYIQESERNVLFTDLLWQDERLVEELFSQWKGKEKSEEISLRRSELVLERWNDLSQKKRELYKSEYQICEMSERIYNDGEKRWICDGTSVVGSTSDSSTLVKNRGCSSYKSQCRGQQIGEFDVVCDKSRPQELREWKTYQTTLATITKEEYSGIIYCPTVSTGCFVARRNGKVFITGNSGFPKSMNIGLAIDKRNGVDNRTGIRKHGNCGSADRHLFDDDNYKWVDNYEERQAQNEWAGWGTQLKPSYEPIIVCRKPCEGSIVDNVMKYGVGGINIDECRVPTEDDPRRTSGGWQKDGYVNGTSEHYNSFEHSDKTGRFPANTILTYDDSDFDEVCGGFPNTKSNASDSNYDKSTSNIYGFAKSGTIKSGVHFGDEGSASRYFMNCKYTRRDEEIWKQLFVNNAENNLEILKATKDNIVQMNVEDLLKELKDHYAKYVDNQLDLIETSIVQDIVEILTWDFKIETSQVIQDFIINSKKCIQFLSLVRFVEKMDNTDITQITQNLLKLFGYVKVAITNYIQGNLKYEQNRYIYSPKASKRDRDEGLDGFEEKLGIRSNAPRENETVKTKPRRNIHPTVKPTSLMQYLVRLVTPKGGIVLDPFNGSGSTGKACMYENADRKANYKYIGIELTEEYLPISKVRIEFAEKNPIMDGDSPVKSEEPEDTWNMLF